MWQIIRYNDDFTVNEFEIPTNDVEVAKVALMFEYYRYLDFDVMFLYNPDMADGVINLYEAQNGMLTPIGKAHSKLTKRRRRFKSLHIKMEGERF